MIDLLNTILALLLVMNLFVLGTSRIYAVIHTVAAQGILLGMLPLLIHHHLTMPVAIMILVAIIVKGVVIPSILFRALKEAQIKREVEPLIGLLPSISRMARPAKRPSTPIPVMSWSSSSSLLPSYFPRTTPFTIDLMEGIWS